LWPRRISFLWVRGSPRRIANPVTLTDYDRICHFDACELFFTTAIAPRDKYFSVLIIKFDNDPASRPNLAARHSRKELQNIPLAEPLVQRDWRVPSNPNPSVREQTQRADGVLDGGLGGQLKRLRSPLPWEQAHLDLHSNRLMKNPADNNTFSYNHHMPGAHTGIESAIYLSNNAWARARGCRGS
jgi:hypothetical protein